MSDMRRAALVLRAASALLLAVAPAVVSAEAPKPGTSKKVAKKAPAKENEKTTTTGKSGKAATGPTSVATGGQAAPGDVGQVGEVRSIEVHSVKLDGKTPEMGERREHSAADAAPAAGPASSDQAPAVDEDIARERVLKQMRRYEKSIDACRAAARKKRPALAGELLLDLRIVEGRVTLAVVKDTSNAPEVTACLTRASKDWQLPASRLTVPYSVPMQ